jgi:hypothetical protein
MILLSRSFVRKRVISLATTLSVGATSLALAHGPTKGRPTHAPVAAMEQAAHRSDHSDAAPLLPENDAAMNKMMADRAVPHHQDAVTNPAMTNPTGSAIVNATGPIRRIVRGEDKLLRRYTVIARGHAGSPGSIVQGQL